MFLENKIEKKKSSDIIVIFFYFFLCSRILKTNSCTSEDDECDLSMRMNVNKDIIKKRESLRREEKNVFCIIKPGHHHK